MTDATLSRGATSVTFTLAADPGDPIIVRDIDKSQPEGKGQRFYPTGGPDPFASDRFSGRDVFAAIEGRLTGASAYSDAQTLLSLCKAEGAPANGDLTLDLSNVPGLSSFTVGVPGREAITINYRPGQQFVEFSLQCEAVQ